MPLKTLRQLTRKSIKGTHVLLRAGFDVPLVRGNIVDDARVRQGMPTIHELQRHGAVVVILAHIGRPVGKVVPALSTKVLMKPLTRLGNGARVYFGGDALGSRAQTTIGAAKPKDVVLMENLRFYAQEEANDAAFAQSLAELGSAYVNDAFSVAHRKHASIVGIPRHLPSYAGLRFEGELAMLDLIREKSKSPFVLVMGGAKISTKLPLLLKLIRRVDHLLVGGAIANTLLAAQGHAVGQSLIEKGQEHAIRALAPFRKKFLLPIDVVIKEPKGKTRIVEISDVKSKDVIGDIGPATARQYAAIAAQAATVFWNGPLGITEDKKFQKGTKALAQALATECVGHVVVGGGDIEHAIATVCPKLIRAHHVFISGGGGAALAYLEAGTLPGLKPLLKH